MSKHTPGPWKVGEDDMDDQVFDGEALICETGGNAANARLIAQAPAMLEELQEAESILTAIGTGYPDLGADSRFQKRLKSVRAILAAVEGETKTKGGNMECPKCGNEITGLDNDGATCPDCSNSPSCHSCGWEKVNTE